MSSMYMFYDGIEGPVTTSGLEKWIELTSFKWGFEREANKALDGSSSWARPPSVREVTVTKRSDKTSTALIQKGLASEAAQAVKFKFTSTAKDKVATFMSFELSKCIVSSFEIVCTEGIPEEKLSLNFTKIVVSFTPRDAGLVGSPTTTTYDLRQGTTT